MAPLPETFDDFRPSLGFDFHFFPLDPLPPGSIQGGLGVHVEIQGIQQHLEMALRLHETAHDSERPYGLPVFGQPGMMV